MRESEPKVIIVIIIKCIHSGFSPVTSFLSPAFWQTTFRKVKSVDRVSLLAAGSSCTKWHSASSCNRLFLIPAGAIKVNGSHLKKSQFAAAHVASEWRPGTVLCSAGGRASLWKTPSGGWRRRAGRGRRPFPPPGRCRNPPSTARPKNVFGLESEISFRGLRTWRTRFLELLTRKMPRVLRPYFDMWLQHVETKWGTEGKDKSSSVATSKMPAGSDSQEPPWK